MVAGAAFAVDVSGNVKASGFAVRGSSKSDDKVQILGVDKITADGDNTKVTFSANGEKAGASITLNEGTSASLWFKPVDMVKVAVGNQWMCLSMEEIDWSNIMDVGGSGYAVEVTPVSGLTANAFFVNSSWGYAETWMTGSTPSVTGLKVAYAADFGTATLLAKYTGADKATTVGLGYAGNVAGITLKVGAVGSMTETTFTSVGGDVYVAANVAGVALKGYVKESTTLVPGADPVIGLGFKAYAGYTLGAVNLGLTVKSDNVLADYLNLAVNTGVGFSIGECSVGTGLNLTFAVDADTAVKYEVPLTFSVGL